MKTLVSSVGVCLLMFALAPAARADRCRDRAYAALENPAELRRLGFDPDEARILPVARQYVIRDLALATEAKRDLDNLELIEPLFHDNGKASQLFNALRDRFRQRISATKANASAITNRINAIIDETCDRQRGSATLPPVTPPPPPPVRRPPPGSYTLVESETEVHNTHERELQIDPGGRRATLRHCCDGGAWDAVFTWNVPETITPGREAKVKIGIDIKNVKPEQELTLGIVVRAPDLAKQLLVKYPSPAKDSATYELPTETSTYSGAREIAVSIDFVSSTVTYHYRRN